MTRPLPSLPSSNLPHRYAVCVLLSHSTCCPCWCHRDEILNRAKEEREVRNAAKQQQRSATVIQAAWRSYTARRQAGSVVQQQWQASFSAAAAAPDMHLSAAQLSEAVRLALQATLPLASHRSRQALRDGRPLAQVPACVRGTIALMLRSMGSSQEQDRYTMAAGNADPQVMTRVELQSTGVDPVG